MENNLNFQRNGFKLNNNSFERRNNFNNNFNNNNFNTTGNKPQNTFKSLDGRVWSNKSDEYAANKEYYQKMLDNSRANK